MVAPTGTIPWVLLSHRATKTWMIFSFADAVLRLASMQMSRRMSFMFNDTVRVS